MDTSQAAASLTSAPNGEAHSSVLTIEGLELGYGSSPVLSNVNLVVERGVCLGLLGPNGAGKTTLLRGLLGILKPRHGRIAWGSPNGAPVRIGYVPQKERLDPSYPLTVKEVVRMGVYGDRPWSPWLAPGQRQRIADALARVGVTPLAERLFSECSGGQRQRVLIARALAAEPNVFIFDEPTTGIDPASQQEVVGLLQHLRETQHITMLLVTQHFGHLEQLFDQVAWVQNRQVLSGPAREFLTSEFISKAFGKA
ncbi:MAG: metal ABC transporter ATP-binding protein [Verrucomicrobia bacterium]|nr:metal ABC transporter ATP-binding protein [Verrucomicrobiota bacterium]